MGKASRIRLLIVDDHPVFRDGLCHTLADEAEFEVVAQEGDGEAALAAWQRYEPDVTLKDVSMFGVDGLEIVWPSEAECQTALEQFSKLHLSHGLGLLDALIAATALGHGSVLNTFNERHYRMYPGLTTVRPYRR